MGNPKVRAGVFGLAAAWLAYKAFMTSEAPSSALAILQYVMLAGVLVGLVGAIREIATGDRPTG